MNQLLDSMMNREDPQVEEAATTLPSSEWDFNALGLDLGLDVDVTFDLEDDGSFAGSSRNDSFDGSFEPEIWPSMEMTMV